MKIPAFDGRRVEIGLPERFSGSNLVALPALVDPHVHFRTPGATHKEDWVTGAQAALAGGVTTVLDMPNNEPPTVGRETKERKDALIEKQLTEVGIPLRYKLYLGATAGNSSEFAGLRTEIAGVKLYMGSTTGNLMVTDPAEQEHIFQSARAANLVVAVHADNEQEIQKQKALIPNPEVRDHSRIRSRKAAAIALEHAIALCEQTQATLYVCHVSTHDEVELISTAKQDGLPIYAETTPHHLFLDESQYSALGTLGQMNPPLRTAADREALWKGIADGVIDTIGSDHAPHTLEEKEAPYPNSPSGVPGIETTLPLLLTAANNGRIALEKIVELTRRNAQKIFRLPDNDDWVIVDRDRAKEVENKHLKTKCGWSPFAGWALTGWPVAVVLNNVLFEV